MELPTIKISGALIKISFEYYLPYVHKMHTLPHARWDAGERVWTVPYNATTLDLVRAAFPHAKTHAETAARLEQEEKSDLEIEELKYLPKVKNLEIKDFVFATKPYWHQKVTFGFCRALDCSAIFLEQGLGKAKVTIDLATWRFRQGQIRRCFVVCPATVAGQWIVEIKKHGHSDFNNYVLCEGSSKDKQKTLEELPTDFTGFIIINYDALRPMYVFLSRAQSGVRKLFDMLVLDESSRIKHAQSQRSKLSWKLGLSVKYRNILTGTPVTQSIEDIFSQFRFLDARIFGPYATAFRSQFLIMGGFENREIRGYKNVDSLMRRIYSIAIRLTKRECLNLPKKIPEKREVVLDSAATAKYLEFEKKCVAEFSGKIVTAPMVMTKLMKLSQITGGFIYEQGPDGKKIGAINMPTQPKLADLATVLEENKGRKVIVCCVFIQEVKLIRDLLNKMKINFVSVAGDVKIKDRAAEIAAFQDAPKVRVLVGQMPTVSFGITLTAAHLMYFYSGTYAYEVRSQTEDRAHRAGLDHSVTYIDAIAVLENGRSTIDQDIMDVKDGKARLANEVSTALLQKMFVRCGKKPDFKLSGKDEVFATEEF